MREGEGGSQRRYVPVGRAQWILDRLLDATFGTRYLTGFG